MARSQQWCTSKLHTNVDYSTEANKQGETGARRHICDFIKEVVHSLLSEGSIMRALWCVDRVSYSVCRYKTIG